MLCTWAGGATPTSCCGAYGHELTWDEMPWLANWCFVRGVNLLYPHAFYYSVRGPRWDERPPDVGPHAAWWDRYKQYADACRRLSFINTDCTHVCDIAILGQSDYLPWRPAKSLFESQRDFNYLEERHLWQDAVVDSNGVHIDGMSYRVLIIEAEPDILARPAIETLQRAGRLIRYQADMADGDLETRIAAITPRDVTVTPAAPGLRVRHVVKDSVHCYLLFNERAEPIKTQVQLAVAGPAALLDVAAGTTAALHLSTPLGLGGHEMKVIVTH